MSKLKGIQKLADEFIETRSERVFAALYERLKPGIINHCNLILKERELAEDAFVNTISKVWTKIDQYDKARGNFSTWCYNIARNESLLILKTNSRYYRSDDVQLEYASADHEAKNPSYTIEEDPLWAFAYEKEDIDAVYERAVDEINSLSPLYKDIMIDREINGMKYEDIADKYGLNRKSVATRIRRARNKIKEALTSENQMA
jgi:RNA polymerase sigma factor (sigma-70 family)